MSLILDLPRELEAELLAHWRRAGLVETEPDGPEDREGAQPGSTDLGRFRLPDALQTRLQDLLDRQDAGDALTAEERLEAESLVELAEFFSLLHLRAMATTSRA